MAKIIRREWKSREMTRLGWRQFIQQLIGSAVVRLAVEAVEQPLGDVFIR
jgi:hypothetical protein